MFSIFKFSFFLKVATFLFFWMIMGYEEYVFSQNASGDGSGFNLDISIPWYFYFLMFSCFAAYVFVIVAGYLFLYKPQKQAARTLGSRKWLFVLFGIELLSFMMLTRLTWIFMEEAFATQNEFVNRAMEFLLNTTNDDRLRMIDKLNAVNFGIALLASAMMLLSFWAFHEKRKTIMYVDTSSESM